jgi:hypothetical protein
VVVFAMTPFACHIHVQVVGINHEVDICLDMRPACCNVIDSVVLRVYHVIEAIPEIPFNRMENEMDNF